MGFVDCIICFIPRVCAYSIVEDYESQAPDGYRTYIVARLDFCRCDLYFCGMETKNPITKSIEIVGLTRLAGICGVTYQSVKNWERRGLPRTDWTGETCYAAIIAGATGNRVTEKELKVRPEVNAA